MTFKPLKPWLLFLSVGMSLWCADPARAALGGGPASVASDAAALQSADRTISLQQYDIHEITSGNGMNIREFMNRAGIVFAVTWTGPAMPDLQALLGVNYSAYGEAVAGVSQRGLHRSLRIATSGMVVETGGHMRAYSGRAYLPALIPAGTPTSDLR